MLKKIAINVFLIVSCFVFSGCHTQSEANNKSVDKGYNFNTLTLEGEKVTQHVSKSPEKVLVIGEKNAERLIYFGLEERIESVAYLESNDNKKIKDIPILAKEWPSKESVVTLKPDLIYGISTAFQKDRLGDFSFWNDQHIAIGTTSNYKNGISPANYFSEIKELGDIFNIEKTTTNFIKEQKRNIEKLTKNQQEISADKVMFIASDGRGNYYYYPDEYSLVDDVVCDLGGNYLDLGDQVLTLSHESLMKINPDRIIFTTFMKSASDESGMKWLEDSSLKNVTAIKQNKLLEVNYDDAIRGNENISNLYQEINHFLVENTKKK